MSRVITANFAGQTFVTTERLWKGDYGQVLSIEGLELPEYYEVHFASTKNNSPHIEIGTSRGVDIPNKFLMATGYIYAWLFLHEDEDDGETKYQIKIPVEDKGIPIDRETPTEKTAVQQAIEALNTETEEANQYKQDSEAWAVGTRNGEPVDVDDPAYENNSKYWADKSKEDAPVTSVNDEKGDVKLTLDDIPDGNTYARATPEQLAQIGTNKDDIADVKAVTETALQPDDLIPYRTATAQDTIDNAQDTKINKNKDDIADIEDLIPNQATPQNQLADKDFVNSSINSSAAFFRGSFNTHSDLFAIPWQTSNPAAEHFVTNNDYAYVAADETHNNEAWRYIYVLQFGSQDNGWKPQFKVNETPLTAAQLAALNSGATVALINQIGTNKDNIEQLNTNKQNKITASGMLKGDGNGAVTVAVAGTDYLEPSALNPYRTASAQDEIDTAQDERIDANAEAIALKQARIDASGILKGSGNGQVSAAVAGTDYATPEQLNDKYTKPATGIPKTDLAESVQQSLDKADTALQVVPNTYRTAAAQDGIDEAQDTEIRDLKSAVDEVSQATTATTIGPAPIVTFDASAADMPLKELTVNIEPVQAGSGEPSQTNDRPISGWTRCKLLKIGQNCLCDIDYTNGTIAGVQYTKLSDGSYLATGTITAKSARYLIGGNWGRTFKPGKYQASCDGVSSNGIRFTVAYVQRYGQSPKYIDITDPNVKHAFEIEPTGYLYSAYFRGETTGTQVNTVLKPLLLLQKNAGSEWEPVQYTTYPITFPTEAGTVYGGTLDVVNGMLKAFPYYASYNGETLVGPWVSSMDVYAPGTNPTIGAQVVDLGGAVTEYDLSDIPEITTILGTNNIWANCGDVTVTYGAYLETLKASLDRTNGELDTLLACIAPIEDSATASQAYAAGAYFFRNGSFCTALIPIDSGGQFTLGTNYQTTTVAAALIALQS